MKKLTGKAAVKAYCKHHRIMMQAEKLFVTPIVKQAITYLNLGHRVIIRVNYRETMHEVFHQLVSNGFEQQISFIDKFDNQKTNANIEAFRQKEKRVFLQMCYQTKIYARRSIPFDVSVIEMPSVMMPFQSYNA